MPGRGGHSRTVEVRAVPKLARKILAEAVEDRVTTSAASLAFHWFLAIFPAIVAAVGLVGLVGLSASQLRSLVHGVDVVLPVQMSQTIDQALRNPVKGAGGGVEVVGGLVVALWSGVEAMAALQVGLDVAFEVSSDRGFVRRRVVAVPLLVLTVGPRGRRLGPAGAGRPDPALLAFFGGVGPVHLRRRMGGRPVGRGHWRWSCCCCRCTTPSAPTGTGPACAG